MNQYRENSKRACIAINSEANAIIFGGRKSGKVGGICIDALFALAISWEATKQSSVWGLACLLVETMQQVQASQPRKLSASCS